MRYRLILFLAAFVIVGSITFSFASGPGLTPGLRYYTDRGEYVQVSPNPADCTSQSPFQIPYEDVRLMGGEAPCNITVFLQPDSDANGYHWLYSGDTVVDNEDGTCTWNYVDQCLAKPIMSDEVEQHGIYLLYGGLLALIIAVVWRA